MQKDFFIGNYMATLSVSFEEIGGIVEFNGLTVGQAKGAIINKAANFLDNFRFFEAGIDNFTDYKKVEINWLLRLVDFPIVL